MAASEPEAALIDIAIIHLLCILLAFNKFIITEAFVFFLAEWEDEMM